MRIILMRHGKPDTPSSNAITANQFKFWIDSYNNASLCKRSFPTEELKNLASSSIVVCSHLTRSIESANKLGIAYPEKIETSLREMEIPCADIGWIKLSPNTWSVIFRILWLFGFSSRSESFSQAKIRAKSAAKLLAKIAAEKQSVLFVGHGYLNRYIAKELLSQGWKGPKNPGSTYWSYGIFEQINNSGSS